MTNTEIIHKLNTYLVGGRSSVTAAQLKEILSDLLGYLIQENGLLASVDWVNNQITALKQQATVIYATLSDMQNDAMNRNESDVAFCNETKGLYELKIVGLVKTWIKKGDTSGVVSPDKLQYKTTQRTEVVVLENMTEDVQFTGFDNSCTIYLDRVLQPSNVNMLRVKPELDCVLNLVLYQNETIKIQLEGLSLVGGVWNEIFFDTTELQPSVDYQILLTSLGSFILETTWSEWVVYQLVYSLPIYKEFKGNENGFEVNGDIVPDTTNVRNIGSIAKKMNQIYAQKVKGLTSPVDNDDAVNLQYLSNYLKNTGDQILSNGWLSVRNELLGMFLTIFPYAIDCFNSNTDKGFTLTEDLLEIFDSSTNSRFVDFFVHRIDWSGILGGAVSLLYQDNGDSGELTLPAQTGMLAITKDISPSIEIARKSIDYFTEFQSIRPSTYTSASLSANTLYCIPFYVTEAVSVKECRFRVVTGDGAGSHVLTGIYQSGDKGTTGDRFVPDVLLKDFGWVTSVVGDKPLVFLEGELELKPGLLYWFAIVHNSPVLSIRGISSNDSKVLYPAGYSGVPSGMVNHFNGSLTYPISETLPTSCPILTNKVTTAASLPVLFFKIF